MSEFDLVKKLRAIGFKGSDEEANGLLQYIGLFDTPRGKRKMESLFDLGVYVEGRLAMVERDLYLEKADLPTPEMTGALLGLSLLCLNEPMPEFLRRLSFKANYRGD